MPILIATTIFIKYKLFLHYIIYNLCFKSSFMLYTGLVKHTHIQNG